MKYARENYSPELVSEMMPLWKSHYEEMAHFKDIILDPDLMVYEAVSKNGALRIYTARKENVLVGYNVFVVRGHPHYRASVSANQDIIFLNDKMREGFAGYRFMKWCDDQLKREGVQTIYQHVRITRNFGPLLERMGYRLMDLIYAKEN